MELTVTKSNDLIEAGYKLTLQEQRIILGCASQVNPFKPIEREFTISALEFSRLFNCPIKNAYTELKNVAETLFERKISVGNQKFRWISGITYHDGEVTLGFSPEILPYLSEIKNRFTRYRLEEISKMSSTYAIRLYELLIQRKDFGKRVFTVEELRKYFDAEDIYPRFFDFKKHTIDVAIEQINEFSSMRVSGRYLKKGRGVHTVEFIFAELKRDKVEPPVDVKDISSARQVFIDTAKAIGASSSRP